MRCANTTISDTDDLKSVRSAVEKATNVKALWAESLANPGGSISDIEGLKQIANENVPRFPFSLGRGDGGERAERVTDIYGRGCYRERVARDRKRRKRTGKIYRRREGEKGKTNGEDETNSI
eukprot:1012292-Amorphochlora_amoeboformis.AAC.1